MKNRFNQRGYTLPEVLMLVWLLACATGAVAVIWIVIHFIAKFW